MKLWTAALLSFALGSLRGSSPGSPCPFLLHALERPSPSCMTFVTRSWMASMKAHRCYTSNPEEATVFLHDVETSFATQYPHYDGTNDWVIGDRSTCREDDMDVHKWLTGVDFYKNPEKYKDAVMLHLDNHCSARDYSFDHRNVVVGESVRQTYLEKGNAIGTITGPSTEQYWSNENRQPSCGKKKFEYTFAGASRKAAKVRHALLEAGMHGVNGSIPWNAKPDVNVQTPFGKKEHHNQFWNMMYDSRFALAPRGTCLWSYRFTEALSAGAIPVIYADNWEIPFKEVFDPSSYLVVIPEADAQKTDEILRGIPQEKIQQLCENGRRIYDSHYSSYDGMLNATLQVLEKWREGGRGPWDWSKSTSRTLRHD